MTGQALRDAILGIVREQTVELHEHVVTSVNGDGTVTLGSDEAAIENVSCSSAYPIRANGDKVLVLKSGPSWTVFAKSETAPADGTITLGNLYDAIDNLHAQVLREIPQSVSLQFGTGAVPAGFTAVNAIGVKDNGGGNMTVYLQTASAMTASTRPAASVRPTGKTITASGFGSWAANGATDLTQILQGGAPQWTGAWFYGTGISDATTGKTVNTMTVTLSRTPDGTTAPVRAYLHTSAAASQPELIVGPVTPFSMAPGETRTWTIPTAWAQRLANPNDPAKGIAVYSGTQTEYGMFTTTSGTVSITFAST